MDINKNIGCLFDLDGVLIDSESEYSRIWKKVNEEFPTGVENLEIKIKGCTLTKILDDHYPDPQIAQKVIDRLYELEGQMKYNYLPGAEKLLQYLKDNKIPHALVTSSNADKMKHLADELPELQDNFDFVVTANLISRSKPDPEGYLLGAEKIRRDIRKCAVFEDSLQGVMAGKRAGAFVVGVAGTLPAEMLAPYSDIIVNSLAEPDYDSLFKILSER